MVWTCLQHEAEQTSEQHREASQETRQRKNSTDHQQMVFARTGH